MEASAAQPVPLGLPITVTPLEVEGFDRNRYGDGAFQSNPSMEHCDDSLGHFTVIASEPMYEVDGCSEFSSLHSGDEIVNDSLSLEDDTACVKMFHLNIYDCDETLPARNDSENSSDKLK